MRARVGDGRGREDEGGVRAVASRHPPQPPQHERDVRAEHAPIDVAFVDDDIAQCPQERRPPLVPRQQRVVQEVRVGQHVCRVLPDPAPLLGRGVPVVGRDPQTWKGQPVHPVELVMGQGLGRREIERSHPAAGRRRSAVEHVREHRNEIAQRLARRRPCRDDDMLSRVGGLGRLDLMAPQLVDARGQQGTGQRRRHPGRQLPGHGLASGDPAGMPQPPLACPARQPGEQHRGVRVGLTVSPGRRAWNVEH